MMPCKAMIWAGGPDAPGQRVTVAARDLADAAAKLDARHGQGNVLDLHGEDDAERPRQGSAPGGPS